MLAASQAFLHNQGPQTKLATGAAAAALRSMSPASTPVSQVQTKRMMDRQGSVGSQNAQRGRSRGNGVHRRGSSSSMTERTFREPSPGRPATATGMSSTYEQEPPVPPLPDTYANVPPIPQKSQRRSVSIDGYRPAAARQTNNRNSMVETSTTKPVTNPGLAAARRVVSGSTAAPVLDRVDSNNSVNFSYPGRARPTSPPPSRVSMDSPTTPVSKTGTPKSISQTETLRIQNELVQASQQPVKKKKQRSGPLNEGSHLQTGTMGSQPTVTPLGPNTAPAPTPSPKNQEKDPNSAKLAGQASHFPPSPVSPTESQGSLSDSEKSKGRRAQRASGALQKQPSIVREDWEGEHEEADSVVGTSPTPARIATKPQTPEANVSRKIENNQRQTDTPASVATLQTPQPRKPSLSPSRSARFSNRLSADMTEGQRHEPPPRSVSPRKPALKHSPSPHMGRERQRDSSRSPSEATDTSNEGRSRSRKAHHVTFDNRPAIVGVSAEPETPVSPVAKSPQNVEKDKRWSALGSRQQKRVVLSEDSDDEDAMKPMPVLPTFGSVRTRGNDATVDQQQAPQSLSSSSSSSLASDTGRNTMETSISSDHAIGGLLARDSEQRSTSLTSAGTWQSESKSHEGSTSQKSLQSADNTSHLPSIAVQPATPGNEESEPKDEWLVDIPGGFTHDVVDQSAEQQPKSVMLSQQTTIMQRPSIDADLDRPRMPSIQEEDSDKDSVYSDAAEDLSDMEGDGFGSINAIVQSPVPPSPTARSPPESPMLPTHQREMPMSQESGTSEWSATQARWKENTEVAKRASLQPSAPIVEKAPTQPRKETYASQVTSNRSVQPASPASSISTAQASPAAPINQNRTAAQPAMRKSMRSAADDTPPRIMRNRPRADSEEDVQRPLRSSMRAAPAPVVKAPVAATPPAAVQGTLQKKNLRTSAPPVQQRLPPVQDDSDSESSFKRRRRAKANDNGKYSMRRSMRASAAPEVTPSAADRRAVRSMSPVERRPFSPVGGQTTMKTTMRGSTDATPSLRPKPPTERRSSSLFGRRKEAKSPTRPMSMGNFSKSRFAADSDDEGAKPAQGFRSRYADSSDDEETLRPVRGIPRRNRDGDDSTDLDDSSDDDAARKKRTTIAAPPQHIPERPTSPMSINTQKKRGLFGRFKKDKEESTASSPVAAPATNGKDKASGKKVKQSGETAALGFSSDAQKEALIEQTRQKLLAANEQAASAAQTPSPGKLQRRQTPQRILSDSWPLPPKIPDSEDTPTRPYTSDGSATPKRPDLERLTSSGTAATSPTSSNSTLKNGKKKRFPMLRRAFGLKD